MPEWLVTLLSMAGGGVAVYAGIRYDIGRMTAKIEAHHDRLERLEDRVYK